MNKSGVFWGLILIIVGALLLVNSLFDWDFISMERLWPIFILIPGLAFEIGYFSNRQNPGLLLPGGILITLSILFFFETFTNWQFAAYTWPIYPLGVAIGLFQIYLFGGRKSGLLIPVFILTAVTVVAYALMFLNSIQKYINLGIVLPALLIIVGALILFSSSGSKSGSK